MLKAPVVTDVKKTTSTWKQKTHMDVLPVSVLVRPQGVTALLLSGHR